MTINDCELSVNPKLIELFMLYCSITCHTTEQSTIKRSKKIKKDLKKQMNHEDKIKELQ